MVMDYMPCGSLGHVLSGTIKRDECKNLLNFFKDDGDIVPETGEKRLNFRALRFLKGVAEGIRDLHNAQVLPLCQVD